MHEHKIDENLRKQSYFRIEKKMQFLCQMTWGNNKTIFKQGKRVIGFWNNMGFTEPL